MRYIFFFCSLLFISAPLISKDSIDLTYRQKHFDHWIDHFTKKKPKRFGRFMDNGFRYQKAIEEIAVARGVPKDLFYLGLIESGYYNGNRSRAGATGHWQFIKGTAIRYGLRIDKHFDERRNLHKSTLAAMNYLKDLYSHFDNWELAFCAYNTGENKIKRAIRKTSSRDYKVHIQKRMLPFETVYYIPKIAAARDIVNNTLKYGFLFHWEDYKADSHFFADASIFNVKRRVDVDGLLKELNIDFGTFSKLNPDIRGLKPQSRLTPTMQIVLPNLKTKSKYVERLDIESKYHQVERGESLYLIAKRYKITLKTLHHLNNKQKRIYPGLKIRVQ